MWTFYLQRLMAAFIAIALLMASPAALVQAAETQAPVQQLRTDQATGTLPGGEFAKIWLALEPNFLEADIRVLVEWDRPNAANNGLFFVVLDPVGLNQVLSDSEARNVALSQGNPVFEGSDNQMEARFTAFGLTTYTLVLGNDSNEVASFLVSVENAVLVDDSDQVEDPNATTDNATTDNATTDTDDEEPADAEDTADTDDSASADDAATDDTAGTTSTDTAADVTATTTTTATATTTDTTTAATTTADTTTATATTTDTTTAGTTTAGVATTGELGEVRATEMEGQLEQDETHYLGLEPSEPDGDIQLILTFDPQDDSEVARRTNMLVLNARDLGQISSSTRPGDLAIAAGNRVFGGASNERRASFQASGLGEYVVLVTNTSTKLVDYDLTVDGGILFDDSGQTQTAQATLTATSTTTATVAAVDADDAATTTAADEDSSASTTMTTTPTTREGTPGGVYVIQSGDTLSLIARDIYGDLNLYDELCAFNNLTNCDRIEVGDEIQLPTTAQLGDIDTSTPATTQSTEEADTSDATDDAAEDEADITATETSTSTSSTTQSSTATTSTTGSATSRDTTTSLSSDEESDIIETLQSSDDFELLYAAIDAADLEKALRGPGPFTLFAPTDAAFSALPDGALDTLLEDPGGQLTTILLYHVVPGRLTADGISDGLNAQTVEGRTVQFGVNGNDVTINDANVVIQGIESSNGIIHVIDAVISPSVTTSSANTNSSSGTASSTESTDSDDAMAETTDTPTRDQQSVIDNLPVLADASDLTSSAEGGNATVSYKTEASIADAAAFYNEQMPLLGFDSTRSTVTDDAATLAFSDDASDIQVSITPDTAAGDVLITITVVET